MPKTTMAMASDFLVAFARLPRNQQRSVRTLIAKFNADSTVRGLNYERINGAQDPNIRSLRIDGGYRAIVLKPKRGDVHMLLWADKHDEAYRWASRHRCGINPETGALQIYAPDRRASDFADAGTAEATEAGAFSALKDRQLTRLGVPPPMLTAVRGVCDDVHLDIIQAQLPVEAYEALFLYLAGESYDSLVLAREAPDTVDTDDFATALHNMDSRSRFVVAESDLDLEAMLNAPLEHWRVFLHPSQRRLVERRWNGPVRVLGGAGTGKTVVAMHRARWLARNFPEGRILFTTFTRNLATDIENNLRSICSPEELRRIEVTNLDRWVARFLRGRRYEFRIQYGREPQAWKKALDLKPPELDLPDLFYSEEWEQVIQANAIASEKYYRVVPRTGRGTRLTRRVRVKIWPVFEEYRAQLAEQGIKEVDDAYRDAAALLAEEDADSGYRAVIVDEAQDMGTQAFNLIRAIAPNEHNNLFIAGDGHQRIYRRDRVVLGRCGINIRGRSRKLRLNYRTTEETRRWAANLLAGREIDDLDGGSDDNRDVKSLTRGPAPKLVHFETREEHNNYLARRLSELRDSGESLRGVCIVARTQNERDAVAEALQKAELAVELIQGNAPDDSEREGVRLATMHRVKGLEFDRVIMAAINDGMVPLAAAIKSTGDVVARESAETEERALVYVAATRAKKDLHVLSFIKQSSFLPIEQGR